METSKGASSAWEDDVREACGYAGAVTASAGTWLLCQVTPWWWAALAPIVFLVLASRAYRRAFVLPPQKADSKAVS